MKGKALRRALESADVVRIGAAVPLITDATVLITPALAQEMLRKNKQNRPINWRKVEEYAATMGRGDWQLTAQGIVLDSDDNVLTGQKRLWAVIYSDTNVLMRVSRGTPAESAKLLDRGDAQSARDLATRDTGRKHSPIEASVARVYAALLGNARPAPDVIAECIAVNDAVVAVALAEIKGAKKTRAVLFVLGAIAMIAGSTDESLALVRRIDEMSADLDEALSPQSAKTCWGKGAAFSLAAEQAKRIVQEMSVRLRRTA